jgi:predicted amidophosphoribosyltransferase
VRCGAPTVWPVERCRECSGRRIAFAHARAAVAYDDVARRVVAAWKEHGVRRLADIAADLVVETVPAPTADCVSFVPPDAERQLWRSVHPAPMLARVLAERWGLTCTPFLQRTRRSSRQRELTEAERRRNLAGVFVAEPGVPGRVVLVDDVYTTGATANAAASALRRAGAREVAVLTFARTLRVR